ncbi:iron complex outermembrane receptor protein [Mesoflavibacter sabulilitoris]|uniref:TonB-dependent siderophore receptor n=1 Tax=Mesoflavibacter zeaxanthinifaciens subsp. sabulilitoris TaxID=1520893 RepID=A0A2T1NKT8_9FLAO|nr:TonB-dependent siderophore receptor [Mesoflavibacter zeaxanthinifaciens]MBB3122527.1 iron complex outermembrane receptor protein [Mesoflavibacter zeaxanthinifaciens subsp. sabulilitoris]PSG93513.1 TonB-dependent siderophore receptor [Mesoflavibacter zeaxanthinifaciens subsp. sabulilitoris]
MLKKISLLLILFTQFAIAQSKIEGQVISQTNEIIPFANVIIEATSKGTSANQEGYYSLENLQKGTYIVKVSYVGFLSQTKTVNLEANQTLTVNFQLKGDTDLEEVEVFGSRFKHPDKIEALTRLPLAPYEQIQSISIISDKLIMQQGNLTISEATKNVPGVYTFATYGNKRESMSSRGFRGIPILKNGVRVHSDFRGVGILTDMQGVDNIQVLKGAASITQGVATDLGSPGGVINLVTKTPKYTFGGNASLRAGSFGQARTTFDVYGPLTKSQNTAFRINGALERADSFRDNVFSDRFYINPSFEWKADDKTTFTFEMDYFEDSRTPDVGTVNLAENDVNAIYDLPDSQFLGYENDKSLTTNATYAIRLDRKLTDKLSLKGAFYKSSLDLDDKGTSLGNVVEDTNGNPIYNQRVRGYSVSTRSDDNSVLQFDLIGDEIETGKLKHSFQVGFDYRTSNFSTTSQRVSAIDTIDVFTANTHTLPDNLSFSAVNIGGAKSKAIGFVAQDVITFNKWFKTFLGVRYSKTQTITETETTQSDAFNPLGGIIVSPFKNINLFASYTNSSYPRTATRLDANGNELGNERFDQFETGIKTNWLNNRLRFNLTYFKINNRDINLPVYDENWVATGYYQKGGNDQRQGIEVELSGRILENLEVITGYSYIDAQYKEHTSFVYGSSPLNTPKHTFNAYANYSFKQQLEGLSVGAGVYYTGERPINDWSAGAVTHEGIVPNQEPFNVDAYTLVNAQVAYKFDQHWNFRVLINNMFNEIGYNAYRTRFINQTDPRNFAGVLTYSF